MALLAGEAAGQARLVRAAASSMQVSQRRSVECDAACARPRRGDYAACFQNAPYVLHVLRLYRNGYDASWFYLEPACTVCCTHIHVHVRACFMVFILHLVCGTLLTSPLSRFVAVLSVVRGAYMRARRAAPAGRRPRRARAE